MTITQVAAKVTRTAAANGSSIDISGITSDWTLCVELMASSPAADLVARFGFQDSVDAFTTPLAGPTFAVAGSVVAANSRKFTFTKKDFPALRFGVTSAVLRLALLAIAGTSPSVTYQAWIES